MKENILNHKLYIISVISIACLFVLLSSCGSDDTNGDTIPPAEVTNVSFVANNGGGTLFYDLPTDDDILFVKATYELDSKKTIYRSSSFYSDSLVIEGFGTVKEYDVELVAVDRSGNESKPLIQKVSPLQPSTNIVLSTVQIIPAFSSVIIKWENVQRKAIIFNVVYSIGNNEITMKIGSNNLTDQVLIENLEAIPYEFKVFVEDDFENSTEKSTFSNIIPLVDIEIDKSNFTFLRDELLPDSMNETWEELDNQGHIVIINRTLSRFEKEGGYQGDDGNTPHWNAKERTIDGQIENFWDGIIDDGDLRNKNFFSTGFLGGKPFSYYIDMGKEVEMSRFRVWQRDWDWRKTGKSQTGYYYGLENIETFEIWISNDKENWERVRVAKIVKPIDAVEAREQGVEGHQFVAYELEPRFSKPFRYLEFRGLSTFDKQDKGPSNLSEISIYGRN